MFEKNSFLWRKCVAEKKIFSEFRRKHHDDSISSIENIFIPTKMLTIQYDEGNENTREWCQSWRPSQDYRIYRAYSLAFLLLLLMSSWRWLIKTWILKDLTAAKSAILFRLALHCTAQHWSWGAIKEILQGGNLPRAELRPKYISSKKYFSIVAALYSRLSYLYNGIKNTQLGRFQGDNFVTMCDP